MFLDEILVPTETLPALIGYHGQKHQDTEKVTNTRISFIKQVGAVSRGLNTFEFSISLDINWPRPKTRDS